MPKSPTNPKGAGRKPAPLKQETYSFRCYPQQIEEIRKLIQEFKINNRKLNKMY